MIFFIYQKIDWFSFHFIARIYVVGVDRKISKRTRHSKVVFISRHSVAGQIIVARVIQVDAVLAVRVCGVIFEHVVYAHI